MLYDNTFSIIVMNGYIIIVHKFINNIKIRHVTCINNIMFYCNIDSKFINNKTKNIILKKYLDKTNLHILKKCITTKINIRPIIYKMNYNNIYHSIKYNNTVMIKNIIKLINIDSYVNSNINLSTMIMITIRKYVNLIVFIHKNLTKPNFIKLCAKAAYKTAYDDSNISIIKYLHKNLLIDRESIKLIYQSKYWKPNTNIYSDKYLQKYNYY